ncbi:MAG: DUF3298 and DUF4163 domain-containing protein [Prevotella sp.]|nr:DUF3298 and DUF4163 domain-containing protein [Prevotella sp.]
MFDRRFLLFFASFLAVVSSVRCAGRHASVDGMADSLVVDSVGKSFSDSLCSSDVSADFPVSGPQPLVDSIRFFLSRELAGSVSSFYSTEDTVPVIYYSDFTDAEGMMACYAERSFNRLRELSMMEHDGQSYESSMWVGEACETDRFVTYLSQYYEYSGGAHGMASLYGTTFDRRTGARMDYPVDTTKLKALQPLLRKGVERYFMQVYAENGERVTAASVQDDVSSLFLENGIIPLPSAAPYLSPEGLVFIYGQYEIGAYAIGMPRFTVPYKDIAPFLTTEARRLAGLDAAAD